LKKALVTGATGFIGRSLCAALKKHGSHVNSLGRDDVEDPWDVSGG